MKRIKELGVKNYNTKGELMINAFRSISSMPFSHIILVLFTYSGEGFLQGGWILFDREGIPRAAFQENAKQRVPIDDILEEVKAMRNNNEQAIEDEK